MKRSGIIILGSVLLFTACKKEQSPVSPNPAGTTNTTTVAKKSASTLAGQVAVSDHGYLILPDEHAYAVYIDFLGSSSVEEIAAFHTSIGFTSQASVEGQAGNYIAPAENNGAYLFSQNAMIQIGQVLYRGVNSEGYYLAMPVSNLNENTYSALVAKSFNPSVMCRLKVGGNYGENLAAFVTGNVGFDDNTNPPPAPEICGKKVTHTYTGGGVTIVDESWYFLGFRYKHVVTIYDGRP